MPSVADLRRLGRVHVLGWVPCPSIVSFAPRPSPWCAPVCLLLPPGAREQQARGEGRDDRLAHALLRESGCAVSAPHRAPQPGRTSEVRRHRPSHSLPARAG